MKYKLSEQDLIREWGIGSRAGAENLYDQHAANIYKVVFSMVRDKDRTARVFEQTFLKIWHGFSEFSAQEHRLAIWVLGQARKVAKTSITTGSAQEGSDDPA